MGGVLDILNISVGTLLNQQTALEITSHNIANISTPNYARQRVVQKARFPMYTHAGTIGRGARIANVEQVRDQFIDRLLLEKNSTYNYYVGEDDIMTKVESLLNETEDYGLSHDLQEFWNGWQDLARNPQGTAERQSIVEKATALADKIRNIYAGFEDFKDGIEQKITDGVTKVNTILGKIADLNKEIARMEVTGHPANDLRDERQQALEDLSEYLDFEYSEQSSGAITVTIDGNTVVEDADYGSVSFAVAGSPADIQFSVTDVNGASSGVDIEGGKFAGWKSMWDKISYKTDSGGNRVDYESKLNDLAAAIIDRVNYYHTHDDSGAVLTNNTEIFSGTDASTIEVNTAIVDNVNLINSGYDDTNQPGDNSVALTLANLGEQSLTSLNNESINGYWQSFVVNLGTDAEQINAKKDFQGALKNELRTEQQAVSGVSMEEEMAKMIQYQHIYQAAARMITTGKEMLDTLINMT